MFFLKKIRIDERFSFGCADFGWLKKKNHGKLININHILSENTNNILMATDIVQVAATKNSFGGKNAQYNIRNFAVVLCRSVTALIWMNILFYAIAVEATAI